MRNKKNIYHFKHNKEIPYDIHAYSEEEAWDQLKVAVGHELFVEYTLIANTDFIPTKSKQKKNGRVNS